MYTNAFFNRLIWWLLAAVAGVLFFRLGAAPVYILDEAKNARCAAEMWGSGQWLVPTFNGELRTDKPPLHYWMMGLSYSLFGVGAWQARLFSAVAGLGTIWVAFYFVKRYLNAVTAFFTALVLGVSTHFLFEFRLAVPDPYLIFFTALGLFSGYAYLADKSLRWLLLAAASLALAALAKGPVALGLPGLSLLLLVLVKKKWWVFTDVRLLVAAIVFLAIASPWYLAVHKATNGAFTQGFFLEHNLNRFSSEMEGHGGPFFVTLLIVLLGLLPFSTNIVQTVKRLWRPQLPEVVWFGAIVSMVYIVFFSISFTKLPNYPMPCYPFAAILLGFVVGEAVQEKRNWPSFTWYILLCIGLALPVGGYLALQQSEGLEGMQIWALGLLVLPAFVLWVLMQSNKGFARQVWWLSMGYFLFNLYFLGMAYPAVYQRNPISQLSTKAGKDVILVAYKDYNAALNFNWLPPTQNIKVFTSSDSLRQFIESATIPAGRPVQIISRVDKMQELAGLPLKEVGRHRDIFETPTTLILEVKR